MIVLDDLREPLHRTGNALIANSAATALLGVVFWAAAARDYTRADVGLNATALSAMMMLAGFSQLNLMSAMVRFLPTAGRDALRFVGSAYAISAVVATVVATAFVMGVGGWLPGLADSLVSRSAAAWFIASTAAWCIFVLQDSVLTGLGRPIWVPIENTVHSAVKLILVVVLAAGFPQQGIFLSWTLAVLVGSIPVNVLLFTRWLPHHAERARSGDALPPWGQLTRFIIGDYASAVCWIAIITIPAQLVLRIEGAAAAAEFSVAWVIGYSLYSLPAAVGQGLVVQGAREPAHVTRLRRMAFVHTFRVLLPAAAVTVLAAPLILRAFGDGYSAASTTALRLLALSSLPHAVVALTVSELRVHRRVPAVYWLMFASLVLVLALTYVLLPRLGIDAVGLAWLISQSGVAAAAVLTRHRLRGEVGFPPTPGFRRRQTSADVRGSQMSELVAATDGRPAPSTSVVVCAFTERRWADLRAALESVRGQTMPPGEVVLVIDHDERLLARVQGLAGVRAVGNRGPQGLSGARNTGVCESRGDIVFFLDDDAAAGAEWIRRSLEQFRDPAVVGVGAWVNPRWDPPGRPNWFPEEFLWVVGCSYGGLPTTTSDIRNPIGAAMAFRRSAFEVVGGFRTDVGRVGAMPSGCEETEFAIRVRQRDPRTRVVLEPSACVSHRVPVERQSLRYFVRRCWHEGRSKRVVTRTVGSADGLAAERGQLARVLPVAVLSGLAGALRTGRLSGVLRAAAVLVGAAATAGGYAVPVAPVTRRAPRSSVPPDRLRR